MIEIGNDRSNQFWEKHCKQERLQADVERDIRESFIRAKYQDRSWIPQPSGESQEALSRQLHICVASNNLMRTIQLLIHGADVSGERAIFRAIFIVMVMSFVLSTGVLCGRGGE